MYKLPYIFVLLVSLLSACGDDTQSMESKKPVDNASPEPSMAALVVYSARKEHLIKPLFDRFTEKTAIEVSYVTDGAGPLLARLQAEGKNTNADVLITVDAGNLWQAQNMGVLSPIFSPILNDNVPAHLRDPNNSWYALTIRARTIVYSSDRVDPAAELSSYEDLADPKWKGRLCLRTSKKVYNQSLVATMIAARGEEATEATISAWVENLAIDPLSNDTKVMEAIAVGQCDVGIVNTYYYGRFMKQKPELALRLYWPNQNGEGALGRGTHINISGAGITKHSRHKAEAQQLLEWFSGAEAQNMLMSLNREAAVNPQVEPLADMLAWGEFKADEINVSEAGRLQTAAVKLMDRVGYR